MIILVNSFLNSKLDLIGTVKFVKQLFRIQIQKGGKVLLWYQVKSRMEACYSEHFALCRYYFIPSIFFLSIIKSHDAIDKESMYCQKEKNIYILPPLL